MSVLITGKHSEIILTEGVGKHTILGMTNDCFQIHDMCESCIFLRIFIVFQGCFDDLSDRKFMIDGRGRHVPWNARNRKY
jgi:hypothetical protein